MKELTKAQKNAIAQEKFRARNKALGRTELRNIMATPGEKVILKKIFIDKLKELRAKDV